MDNSTNELLEVGVVAGTHGLRGDLKIRTLPTGDLALPGARQVFLKDAAGSLSRCQAVRIIPHKNQLLLRLAECPDIDAAKPLVGQTVWMLRTEVPAVAEDQYLWHDLEGLEVVDRRLGPLGHVVGMFSTPAHDILEIDGATEILIPAIPPFIDRVDAEAGLLLVDLPDGLVEPPDAE